MGLAERIKTYMHLGNSDVIAKAVFADHGLDLGKEAARLNNKAPELAAGEILLAGARDAVDAIIRTERIPTAKGDIRPYVYRRNLETPEVPADLAADLREGIQQQYERNAEDHRRGDFVHILDCTIGEITNLAARYRKIAQTYHVTASRYEWLAQEAARRGIKEDDVLRTVFTEEEIVQASIPTQAQPMFELENAAAAVDDQPHT